MNYYHVIKLIFVYVKSKLIMKIRAKLLSDDKSVNEMAPFIVETCPTI
jgi:hypothetical protein